ncbi:MAG TPA: SH3 domain-containing protein [Anaerolineae bacterium]|nr:SH3 domain-containing protein [Anaerolineae bacterium]
MLHRTLDRSSYVAVLLVAALLLAGCPGNSVAPATSTPAEPAATVALLASPTLSATEVPTDVPTPTEPPSTATPTEPPPTATHTATPRPPTPTAPPPTDTPTATPTTAPQPQTVRSANLRAGPGTNYAVVGSADAQQTIEPLGRNTAGDWLQIQSASGEAWIAAFLVENVDAAGLPVRESTAPTVTLVPQAPAATPAPVTQAPPAAGAVACGAILPAPTDLQLIDKVTGITTFPGSYGFTATQTVKLLSWRWDALDRVRGLDWYFDLQYMLGSQPGNPVLRTIPITPNTSTTPLPYVDVPPYANGVWTIMATDTWQGASISPEFFSVTCPPGEPRCPLHARVQVALRDGNGNFACFISPPSNAVPLPLP